MSASIDLVEVAPVREEIPQLERPAAPQPEPAVRQERKSDRWFLAALLALCCVLAAAAGKFIFSPALDSLTGTTDSSWTSEGP